MKNLFVTLLLLFLSAFVYGQTDSIRVDTSLPKKTDSATVYVQFIVLKNGEVSNAKVKKTICNSCDKALKKQFEAEALRVIQQSSPLPNPTGKKVGYVQPIKFVIGEE